jgi:hypothetical protein
MVTKTLDNRGDVEDPIDGIPAKFWQDVVKSRLIRKTATINLYKNDDGDTVGVKWRHLDGSSMQMIRQSKTLMHDNYVDGKYDEFLECLRLVSESSYCKLIRLFRLDYRYTTVTKIEQAGRKRVYDLSMAEDEEPAFIANGLVIHNTHQNYAKALHQNRMSRSTFSVSVTILTDTLSSIKLMDDVQLNLADSQGNVDAAYSGIYKVTGIIRHISRARYVERITLSAQGSGNSSSGGASGGQAPGVNVSGV